VSRMSPENAPRQSRRSSGTCVGRRLDSAYERGAADISGSPQRRASEPVVGPCRSVLEDPTERDEIPEAVRPLLTRTDVRTTALSRQEAVAIRDWAQTLPGWQGEPGLQLLRHRS